MCRQVSLLSGTLTFSVVCRFRNKESLSPFNGGSPKHPKVVHNTDDRQTTNRSLFFFNSLFLRDIGSYPFTPVKDHVGTIPCRTPTTPLASGLCQVDCATSSCTEKRGGVCVVEKLSVDWRVSDGPFGSTRGDGLLEKEVRGSGVHRSVNGHKAFVHN